MNNIDEAFGITVLRVGLGVMWIAHALLKWFVFTIAGLAAWLESQGLPGFMAWPLFIVELVGGMLILIGWNGRYISAVLVPVLLIAAWTHFPNGWLHTNEGGGWEYPIFLAVASIAHALLGDGRFAMSNRQAVVAN